ncbi:ABC transporter substrate-binding protein [Pseudobacteriovorax antillogorgiicola]|uniref:Carbohydrate ABC transporter substrate-binding protein, CUT1 family n=1 Tax=Pseudobacteriovorax antillogorgiicola TaxID=1513793 RepID=A0A1Y6CQL0_9BACT|nr:extracellular solute-binding protein [Pseudobacteriovorax antillogorgiicola]TCS42855.1 carbohydrate ABC transporter substrate-binding protein (CUT1 family) [Pseudobacteriovorax antillogorgiicola]SMF81883.1 carbohydrate ABC transporter substrate-binding protein, CUT1 family [Pseudobacteriovorax antillogorgiicola]
MITRRHLIRNIGHMAMALYGSQLEAKADQNSQSLQDQVTDLIDKQRFKGSQKLTLLYPKGCLANLEPAVKIIRDLTKIEVLLKESALDQISVDILMAQKVGRDNFDIALPPTFAIPDLVAGGHLEDLSPYAKVWEPKEYRKSILYSLGDRHLGKLYGYQTDGDVYLMFLNKRWLENKDLRNRYAQKYQTELTVPKTWPELDRQIAFMHNPEANRCDGLLFRNLNYVLWEYWIRLHGAGLFPFDKDMNPQLADDRAIQALDEMTEVTRSLCKDSRSNGLFENFKSFAEGNKYCNLGWGGTQKFLNGPQSKIKDDLIVVAPPGGQFGPRIETLPYFNWGWNFCVSSQSRQKELAYLICLLMGTPQVSVRSVAAADGYFDPYRSEHHQDPEIIKTYGTNFLDTHRNALSRAIPDLYLQGQGQYLAPLKQAVFSVTQKQMPAKIALKQVSAKWQKITDQLGREEQVRQWGSLRAAYPDYVRPFLS